MIIDKKVWIIIYKTFGNISSRIIILTKPVTSELILSLETMYNTRENIFNTLLDIGNQL